MPLAALETWLLRAPLLGVAALDAPGGAGAALTGTPIGTQALALASPDLAEALARGDAAAVRARDRYGRRAATRPTPHGLLAGVATGTLADATAIDTGVPVPRVAPTWARLAALGRALLDEPAARARVRVAPSLITSALEHRWLACAGPECHEARAEREPDLDALVAAAARWIPWARANVLAGDEDLLRALVDDGLLVHDLSPPLVGPAPLAWMRTRLARTPFASALDGLAGALDDGDLDRARGLLGSLPGAAGGNDLHAVLVFPETAGHATLSRAAVARAQRAAGLLFRLQDALHPPASERHLDPTLPDALAAIDAVMGPGALALADLATGRLGATVGDEGARAAPAAPPPELIAHLVSTLLDAARAGAGEVALDPDALDALLPAAELPRTFELFLTPAREPDGAAPGAGWLLGLHAPAGATWGRFAHALGAPLTDALRELAGLERTSAPAEERVDVAWAPSPELADVACHPPVRARCLALAGWPERGAITPASLELVADPSSPAPLLLRAGDAVIAPAPLSRLRAATAPPGIARLLVGWSLYRQHAPWALVWPASLDLARTPRVTLDGFVIAPASWRLPAARDEEALAGWRAAAGVPRWILVGEEDELLAVDLDAPDALRDLAGHERAVELWPPPGRLPDAAGRRVEAVIAVVEVPDAEERAQATTPASRVDAGARAARRAPRIPAPADAPPAPHVMTLKLFGIAEGQDRLLDALGPVLLGLARAKGPLRSWWFQRFVEPPGERAHLRLRLVASSSRTLEVARQALAPVLEAARSAGDLVDLAEGPYRPELGRFGTDAPAVELVFASESRLVVELVGARLDPGCDLLELAVRAADALAAGLGLAPAARLALAERLRGATAGELTDEDEREALDDLRARRERLDAALARTLDDPPARWLAEHERRLARLRVAPRHLPALIHLGLVRLAGPSPGLEAAAALVWERSLASRQARRRRPTRRP